MSCRKQRKSGFYLGVFLYLFSHSWSQAGITITGLSFNGAANPAEIAVEADGPIAFEKTDNAQDKQVVLEITGASISDSAAKAIDTSSFNSNVGMISPYQVQGQTDLVRIVIQLRADGSADIIPGQNSLKILVPNSKDSATQGPKSPLDEYTQNKEAQKFTGTPVTLQIRDGEVEDVLRLIGEASGFNVIIGDDVKGKITLSLIDVPWDQALDVVLHTMHLGADRSNNILRVGTLASLTAEKTAELVAAKAAQAAQPRVTRVFPVSYAKLTDLQGLLSKFASSVGVNTNTAGAPGAVTGGAAGGGANALGVDQSIVQSDERTNSIVVRDTIDNLDKMRKLIEILDTQTPQVMIEAKIIEASEDFSKSLGGSLGFGGKGDTALFGSIAGGNPIDPLFGSPGVFAAGSNAASTSVGTGNPTTYSGNFGLSPSVSFIPGLSRLTALINLGESESQLKVISSPKTVVLSKESAKIVEGTPVLVQTTTYQNGVSIPLSTVQSANVSLDVKPTVTNEGSVLMELTISKDIPQGPGIAARNLHTTVLVESGTTLVIGGIYGLQSNHESSGIPILRKLPLIGALFGSETDDNARSELFIFITPRILNARESGIAG